jgi:hypothetical protein
MGDMPDSYRISFQTWGGDYFYPIVLAKNDCKIIKLTGHPNNKF